MRALVLVALAGLAAVACTGPSGTSATSPVVIDGTPPPSPVQPVPERCPHALPDRLPREAMAGVGRFMVPPTPGALVICVSGTRTVVDPAQVAPLADDLNRLERVRSAHIFACPADLGPTFALFFDYPDGTRLLVEVDSSGCRFATNGRRTGVADTRLLRKLHRLAA
jgi:hypothetical protein